MNGNSPSRIDDRCLVVGSGAVDDTDDGRILTEHKLKSHRLTVGVGEALPVDDECAVRLDADGSTADVIAFLHVGGHAAHECE